MTMRTPFFAFCACLLLVACGGDEPGPTTTSAAAPSDAPKLLLDSDPGEAKGIFEVRKMKPGEEVVAFGRVQHIEKGFAAIRLIDDELDWCGRGDNPNKDMTTPWTYCCADPKVRAAALLPVEVRKEGEVVEATDLGLRHLDLIAVKGKLEETEGGGLVLVANGWFRKERPDLSDRTIDWP